MLFFKRVRTHSLHGHGCLAKNRNELIWHAKDALGWRNRLRKWLWRQKRQRLNQSLVDCKQCRLERREFFLDLYNHRQAVRQGRLLEEADIGDQLAR